VKRRLRSSSPVLAELSGGMDSSSIVCVADAILATGNSDTPRLDNHLLLQPIRTQLKRDPYFTKVEQLRGRKGTHIDVEGRYRFFLETDEGRFTAMPGTMDKLDAFASEFVNCIASNEIALCSPVSWRRGSWRRSDATTRIRNLVAKSQNRSAPLTIDEMGSRQTQTRVSLLLDTLRLFFNPLGTSGTRPPCWLTQHSLNKIFMHSKARTIV